MRHRTILTNASRKLNPCGSVARTVDLRFYLRKKKKSKKVTSDVFRDTKKSSESKKEDGCATETLSQLD
jgi:hypothetical protein